MSFLSSGKLEDIKYLYENVVSGNQEVLSEDIDANAFTSFNKPSQKDTKNLINTINSGVQKAKADRATQQRAELGVVKTNKGYIAKPGSTSYDPEKGSEAIKLANRLNKETGLGKPKAPKTSPQISAKGRSALNPTTSSGNGNSSRSSLQSSPAASVKPAPTAAKPVGVPAKTAPAAAGDGMKAWAAAHPDLAAKVKPGQSGYNSIQQQRNAASLSAPKAPASSTLGKTVSAASKPSAFTPGSEVAATNKASSNPLSGITAFKPAGASKTPTELTQSYEYDDAYDLVLEYLLDTGHAETIAEAQYIMTELDQESINQIAEQSIGSRAANAVEHQRAGTLGDDDEIRQNQDATSTSIGKLKRGSGAKVTPTLPGV